MREYAWSLQPEVVITRDLMKTPEQNTPNEPLPRPWEACYTMGTDWGYKPNNDPHKTGTQVIDMLIEIRSKGGNFLMNIGPKPNGEIQIEQEAILQEVALWNFANSESIYQVKPLPVIREDNIWYTQSNDEKYIYAYVTRSSPDDWKYGDRKAFVLTHIEGNAKTTVTTLGYKAELVEYKKDFDARTYVSPTGIGLVVSIIFILRGNMKLAYFFKKEQHHEGETIHMDLAQEVSFLNKAAIKQTLAHLPENSKLVIDAANTVYIDYDVLELLRDFVNFGSKDKNITVTLKNFKPAYKMEDAMHVHSEQD